MTSPSNSLARAARLLWREIGFVTGRYAIPHRLYWKVKSYTGVSLERLDNVYRLAREVEERNLEGALVECGVWKGGCAAVLAWVAREHGWRRRAHLFDSFEGLPEPTTVDGALAERYAGGRTSGRMESIGKCVGTLRDVEEIFFGRLRIERDRVSFHPGWFQETMPKARAEIGPIALLRLDADWYESTKVCLEALYPRVVPGGFVILDDYGKWEGCRRAFHEYMAGQGGAAPPLKVIDPVGVYFVKA